MSLDILFGSTAHSWSRDLSGSDSEAPKEAPLTEKEKDRIEKLAKLEMLASRGDTDAQKKMVEINAALAVLQKRAAKGDTKSKRLLATLKESGLVALSESKKGPKLVMAGAGGRTRRPRQQGNQSSQNEPADPSQQVQEFLLSLKMRAMAGDPQAMAILSQYQQIITPPGAAQMPEGPPPAGNAPEGYPPQSTPMAGALSENARQSRRQRRHLKIQALKSRAQTGDAQAVAALQILQERRARRHARRSGAQGASVGYNRHWAYIHGLGEEEIALAREGGKCERSALRRRF